MWMEFLALQRVEDLETQDKSDVQTAIIAAEVRRSWVKDPSKVRTGDFLRARKTDNKAPISKRDHIRVIKERIFTALGRPKEDS